MTGRRVTVPQGLPKKPEEELPDATFPYGPCPRCGRHSNFTALDALPLTYSPNSFHVGQDGQHVPDVIDRVAVLKCTGCHNNVAVVEQQCIGGIAWRDSRQNTGGLQEWQGIHWWPAPGMTDNDPDVPEAVRSAIAEGTRSLAVRAPRAAVVMFRGGLAEIVSDRGSAAAQQKNSLYAQLKQMSDEHALDPSLSEWAKEIRVLGNAGAHPNQLQPVEMGDAKALERLMDSLVEYLYRVPAKLARSRAARSTP